MGVNNDFNNVLYQEPRVIPVILLLDSSGSMAENGKIDVLNSAVRSMLDSFKNSANSIAAIKIAVIAFGGSCATVITKDKNDNSAIIQYADEVLDNYVELQAYGMTPMGNAFALAKNLIEDKDKIPSRCYRPYVVLVSDGMPNDNWEHSLNEFTNAGRSAKCYRMSMGIGVNKGTDEYLVLEKFASNKEAVFEASDANGISKFFRFVTMSTTARAYSSNPNAIPEIESIKSLVYTDKPKRRNDEENKAVSFLNLLDL